MSAQSWYDHPVIALAGAFGAGVASTLTIAIPLYSTSWQNNCDAKVRQIDDKYANDKADIANMAEIRKENIFFRNKLAEARAEVWQLSDKKPFQAGSPIPVGLESIQPGIKIDDVKAILPKSKMTVFKNEYFFELSGGLITQLQIKATKGMVKSVTYYVQDDDVNRERLMGAVSAAFGQPTSRDNNEDGAALFHWKVGNKRVTVFGNQYSIDNLIG